MTPKRAAEMVDGGSIYRVFKGVILCRQRILADRARWARASPPAARSRWTDDVVRVAPTPRRAFQGWRYLEAKDAPPDLRSPRTFGESPQSWPASSASSAPGRALVADVVDQAAVRPQTGAAEHADRPWRRPGP